MSGSATWTSTSSPWSNFDLVVLAVGLDPKPVISESLAHLGIELNEFGFCKTSRFSPLETSRPGVFVAGAFQEPKDIPETVTQASARRIDLSTSSSNSRQGRAFALHTMSRRRPIRIVPAQESEFSSLAVPRHHLFIGNSLESTFLIGSPPFCLLFSIIAFNDGFIHFCLEELSDQILSKEVVMECEDVDKVKPLDKLLEDQIEEFDSGKDAVCDKELDKMMWELGDYENKEPTMEAKEFEEKKPIEEELVEKRMIHGSNKKPYYMEDEPAKEDIMPGDEVVAAHSISPDKGK